MAVVVSTLQTELVDDPKGFYGSAVVEKDITKIFYEINLLRSGASYTTNVGKVLGSDVFALIEGNDYDALATTEKDELLGLLGMDAVDASNKATVKIFQRLFAATSTLSILADAKTRDGSRAEMLFDESVTRDQIHEALIGA